MRLVASLRGAAAFVDRVGVALVFPKEDVVLPSLWEAVAGTVEVVWAVRDADGRFVEFTPEMARVWRWKDELPGQRLVCGGKHVRGRASLVSLQLLPALYALTGRDGATADFREATLTPVERDVAELVLETGPSTTPELQDLLAHDERKRVAAAVDALQRALVLTSAGIERRERGWPAICLDLLPRRYAEQLRVLPSADDARQRIAASVLARAGEISAVDLTGALGWRKADAVAALNVLADAGRARVREEDGITLWRARRARA